MKFWLFAAVSASPIISSVSQKIFSNTGFVVRVDRSLNDETAVNAKIVLAQPRINTVSKALENNEAFEFSISCNDISNAECLVFEQELKAAGSRIAEVLSISNAITVSARFRKFCAGQDADCMQGKRLASARYGSAFVVAENSHFSLYNQALVKQLKTDVMMPSGAFDIFADFNADVNWYFQSDTPITSDQMDFQFVACHELTHGLGFGSGFINYDTLFAGLEPNFLAPLMLNLLSDPTFSNSTVVPAFEPLDAFDNYLYSNDISFKDLAVDIASFGKKDLPAAEFMHAFQQSGIPFKAGKAAYSLTTLGENTLFFKTNDGEQVAMYSPLEFKQGSTLSHVGFEYQADKDFLMIPALKPGVSIGTLMESHDMTTIYGPNILGILTTIGWPTHENPEPKSINLAINFLDIPVEAASDGNGTALPGELPKPENSFARKLGNTWLIGILLLI